jgi:lysine 2,3-aminomutase
MSGGDPFLLNDSLLEYLLQRIKSIPHVEFVRIGTRVPVSLPQRITPALLRMLKKYSPLWISIHCNHPKELTPCARGACGALADIGIPLGSQTVLLKGINDDPLTMKALMHALLKIRVRPYYIYQCDPVVGTRHFRATIQGGLHIMEQLQGFTSGYAVPNFVLDVPGGGGKIPLNPNYIVRSENGQYVLRNYAGKLFYYSS